MFVIVYVVCILFAVVGDLAGLEPLASALAGILHMCQHTWLTYTHLHVYIYFISIFISEATHIHVFVFEDSVCLVTVMA